MKFTRTIAAVAASALVVVGAACSNGSNDNEDKKKKSEPTEQTTPPRESTPETPTYTPPPVEPVYDYAQAAINEYCEAFVAWYNAAPGSYEEDLAFDRLVASSGPAADVSATVSALNLQYNLIVTDADAQAWIDNVLIFVATQGY